jgi:hypothetical protein
LRFFFEETFFCKLFQKLLFELQGYKLSPKGENFFSSHNEWLSQKISGAGVVYIEQKSGDKMF